MQVTLITPTAYARHRKCDEKAVRKAILAGRISTINGKIDAAVADIQWRNNTRARAGSGAPGRDQAAAAPSAAADPRQAVLDAPGASSATPFDPAGPADATYSTSRARREAADALKAELEVQKMAGSLVERARVESAVFDAFRSLRDRCLSVPSRCAPKVVGLVEVREIEQAMTDELRSAFDAFESATAQAMSARLAA